MIIAGLIHELLMDPLSVIIKVNVLVKSQGKLKICCFSVDCSITYVN